MDPVKLEKALEKKCKNHAWLAWIVFLTATPIMFNSAHLTSYVFLGGNPSFFCNIPELVEANWTKEQIREVSSPGLEKESCVQYAWNYSLLRTLDFDDALNFTNLRQKPDIIKCKSYIYDEETVHQTIVSEWDLVCDNLLLRSTAQSTVAFGKLSGALFFGLISDRFGRKKTFVASSMLYIVASHSAAFVNSYLMFIIFRLLIGLGGAGVLDTGYTILLELTVKNYRAYAGTIYNTFFSFGMIFLPLAAYLTNNWRQLQIALSVPMFICVIQWRFLPESPRWLITAGKLEKAIAIIGTKHTTHFNESDWTAKDQSHSTNGFFFYQGQFKFFTTNQLSKKILILCYLWFLGSFNFFIIAFSGLNFDVNQYIYIGLNGIIDLPGILLPVIFLSYFGRRTTGIILWSISGVATLLILIVPQGWPMICVTLGGRLAGVAARGVIMIHSLELFPTKNRNTALGCFSATSQFGPLLAPYVVDILGKIGWWIPTTLSGSLALLGAFLLIFVPETRNVPMMDTVCERKLLEKEALSEETEKL